MDPVIAQLKASGVAVESIDIAESTDRSRMHRVDRIPTVIAVRGQDEIGRIIGVSSEGRIRQLLEKPRDDVRPAPPAR